MDHNRLILYLHSHPTLCPRARRIIGRINPENALAKWASIRKALQRVINETAKAYVAERAPNENWQTFFPIRERDMAVSSLMAMKFGEFDTTLEDKIREQIKTSSAT